MPKIKLDKSKCIGCGTCWVLCDKFFSAGDDNKSTLKGSSNGQELEVDEIGCAQVAVDTCPTQCIKIL
ncbi:MAG: ferredoxin [bacterium]|nr:ferredoxin [bacterium]